MEVFKIWSTLNIKGNALSEMTKFAALVSKASKDILLLQKSLGMVGGSLSKENAEFRILNENLASTSVKTSVLTAKNEKLAMSLKSVAASGAMAGKSMMHGGMSTGEGMATGLLSRGNLAIGGAMAAGFMIKSGFEHEKEYQKRMMQLKGLGFSQQQMNKVGDLANSGIKGVSKIDMIEAVVAAQMATRAGAGQWSEVQTLAPQLAKSRLATNVMFGGMSEKQQQDLIRFAEIQGGSDVKNQARWLKAGTSMMISSGGSIMPNRQLQFSQLTAGSLRLTPEAYLALEPVLQELQSRTGTGLTTGMRALGGGMTMTGFSKKSINFWEKIGLFKGTFDKTGRPLGVHMPDEYTKMNAQDPLAFIKNIMLPLLNKAGYKSSEDIHKALLELPRTYSMVAWSYYKNMDKVDRAREMSKHVVGGDSLQSMLEKNPAYASARVGAAWSSFATAFGHLTSPTTVAGLNTLASLLEGLTRLMGYWAGNKEFRSLVQKDQAANIKALSNITPFMKGITGGAMTLSPGENKTFGKYTPDYYGKYSSAIIGEPDKTKKNQTVTGNVYLDKRKVGEIVSSELHNQLSNAGTLSSPTSVNANYGLPPIGLSIYGGQQ